MMQVPSMMLADQSLSSALAMVGFVAVVALVKRIESGKTRVAAAFIFFLILEGVMWSLYPFTPPSYILPPVLGLVFALFVELGRGGDYASRSASQLDVREVFQERRTRFRRFSLLPMAGALVIFLWGEVMHMIVLMYVNHVPLAEMERREGQLEGGWFILIVVVPLLLFVGGLVFGLIAYRCPVCEKIPMRSMGDEAGPDLNPTECPHCGARLA